MGQVNEKPGFLTPSRPRVRDLSIPDVTLITDFPHFVTIRDLGAQPQTVRHLRII